MRLNINSNASVKFTAKLERMRTNDLPSAVRSALNDAAYDVKTNTMPKSADRFEKRSPNFFKANSKYEKATGTRISTMKSIIGFFSNNLKGGNNHAVKDLEQQEKGGMIKGKALIPMRQARIGQQQGKNVRPINRTTAIRNVVDSRQISGVNNAQKLVKAIVKAGKGGHVLSNGTMFAVNSANRGAFKLTPLYSYEKGRGVKVKETKFMESASLKSGSKLEGYFEAQARKRIFR